jgi:hypothetical protein
MTFAPITFMNRLIVHDGVWWDENAEVIGAKTVFTEEWSVEDSGLLDAQGRPLMRVPDQRRIGFNLGRKD